MNRLLSRVNKGFHGVPETPTTLPYVGVISFARGVPAPECLPVGELADCARAALERDGETILNYGPVGGYGPLREWVAERHGVEPGRVLVTNGSLPGLNLVLAHFAARGRILVEAPARLFYADLCITASTAAVGRPGGEDIPTITRNVRLV